MTLSCSRLGISCIFVGGIDGVCCIMCVVLCVIAVFVCLGFD